MDSFTIPPTRYDDQRVDDAVLIRRLNKLESDVQSLADILQSITECRACYGHGHVFNNECLRCHGTGQNPAISQEGEKI